MAEKTFTHGKQMANEGGNVTVITCYDWTYLARHGWRRRPEIRVVKSRLCHPEISESFVVTLLSCYPPNIFQSENKSGLGLMMHSIAFRLCRGYGRSFNNLHKMCVGQWVLM